LQCYRMRSRRNAAVSRRPARPLDVSVGELSNARHCTTVMCAPTSAYRQWLGASRDYDFGIRNRALRASRALRTCKCSEPHRSADRRVRFGYAAERRAVSGERKSPVTRGSPTGVGPGTCRLGTLWSTTCRVLRVPSKMLLHPTGGAHGHNSHTRHHYPLGRPTIHR
jgi:hypothetical protein